MTRTRTTADFISPHLMSFGYDRDPSGEHGALECVLVSIAQEVARCRERIDEAIESRSRTPLLVATHLLCSVAGSFAIDGLAQRSRSLRDHFNAQCASSLPYSTEEMDEIKALDGVLEDLLRKIGSYLADIEATEPGASSVDA